MKQPNKIRKLAALTAALCLAAISLQAQEQMDGYPVIYEENFDNRTVPLQNRGWRFYDTSWGLVGNARFQWTNLYPEWIWNGGNPVEKSALFLNPSGTYTSNFPQNGVSKYDIWAASAPFDLKAGNTYRLHFERKTKTVAGNLFVYIVPESFDPVNCSGNTGVCPEQLPFFLNIENNLYPNPLWGYTIMNPLASRDYDYYSDGNTFEDCFFEIYPPQTTGKYKLLFGFYGNNGQVYTPPAVDDIKIVDVTEDYSHEGEQAPYMDVLLYRNYSKQMENCGNPERCGPQVEFFYAPWWALDKDHNVRAGVGTTIKPEQINSTVQKLTVPARPDIWYSEFFSTNLYINEQDVVKKENYPIPYRPYYDFVYPFVYFKTQAARDRFVNGNTGNLPWHSLNRDEIIDGSDDFQDEKFYGDTRFYNKELRNRFRPEAGDSVFMVIDEQHFMNGAIIVKSELDHEFNLSVYNADYFEIPELEEALAQGETPDMKGYKLRNKVKVTYTNAAPYPVSFRAFQPMVDGLSVNDAAWQNLALVVDNENSSPEVAEGWGFITSFINNTKDTQHPTVTGQSITMLLLPGETRELTWAFTVEHKESDSWGVQNPAPKPHQVNPVSFRIETPVVIATTITKLLADYGGEVSSRKTIPLVKLPCKFDNFGVIGAFPQAINNEQDDKYIYIVLRNAKLLDKIQISGENISGLRAAETIDIDPADIEADPEKPGSYKISLDKYIGAAAGEYNLLVSESRKGTFISVPFNTSPDVEVKDLDNLVKRLVITQYGNDNAYRITNDIPKGYEKSDKLLLDIGGYATYSDATPNIPQWEIGPGAVINGILELQGGNAILQAVKSGDNFLNVKLIPSETAEIHYLTEKGHNFPLAKEGKFGITLAAGEEYFNTRLPDDDGEYEDDFVPCPELQFNGVTELYAPGMVPFIKLNGVYILKSQLSIAGEIALSALMGTDLMRNLIEGDLNVQDFRISPRGPAGTRADVHFFFGAKEPLGVLKFGAEADIEMNTLPETSAYDKHLNIAAGIELSCVGGVSGKLGFAPLWVNEDHSDIWFLNDIYGELNAPIPLGPQPVVQITALGLGISGIANSMQWYQDFGKAVVGGKDQRMENTIPLASVQATLGIGLANDMLGVQGTATIGMNEIGLINGKMTILMSWDILQDVFFTLKFQDLGPDKRWEFKKGNNSIPMVKTSVNIGGTLWISDLITGSVAGSLAIDPSYCHQNQAEELLSTITEFFTIDPYLPPSEISTALANKLKLTEIGGRRAFDLVTTMLDFNLSGTGKLSIPKSLGLGDHSVSGKFSLNKERVTAQGDINVYICIGLGPWKACLDKNLRASFAYWFYNKERDWNVQLRAKQANYAGQPLFDNLQTLQDADMPRPLFVSNSTFIPMMKDDETSSGMGLRAFTEEFGASKTQTVENISKTFSVAVRSKSNTTGLRLSNSAPAGEQIVTERTAAELEWEKVEDTDYYVANVTITLPTAAEVQAQNPGLTPADITMIENMTLAGAWTMEAYNADVTAIDANGLIDCDFYYVVDPPAIDNFAYNYATGAASFSYLDLKDEDTYRIRLSAVDAADETLVYPVTITGEWQGDAPLTSLSFTQKMLEDLETLPTGNYLLLATLERHEGYYTLDDAEDAERFIAWNYYGEKESPSFAYTNPLQPVAPVSNVAAVSKNGGIEVTWDEPGDKTNIAGYQLHLIDENGIATLMAVKAAGETTARLEVSEWQYYTPYTVSVTPYNQGYSADATIKGAAAESNSVEVTRPERPRLTDVSRINTASNVEDYLISHSGGEPHEMKETVLAGNGKHNLQFISNYSLIPVTGFEIHISNKLDLTVEKEEDMDYSCPNNITSSATFDGGDKIALPLAGMEEGEYRLLLKLFNGGDYNEFAFKLIVDNKSPELKVSDKTQTENGEWIVQGVTEVGTTLLFNGAEIAHNGSFSVKVAEDQAYISLKATDLAGNVSVVSALLSGFPELPEGDVTSNILISFTEKQLKLGDTFTATATVERGNQFVTLEGDEQNKISWSAMSNDVLSIDPLTGEITPLAAGETFIVASYLSAYKDIAGVEVAEEFTVNDLYVSQVEEAGLRSGALRSPGLRSGDDKTMSITLTFTEPLDATGKAVYYSSYIENGTVPEDKWEETTGIDEITNHESRFTRILQPTQ